MSRLVVGIGDPALGDDGVGARAVDRIEALRLPDVRTATDLDGSGLLELWSHAHVDVTVLVDAVLGGAPPGTLHVLEAGQEAGDDRSWATARRPSRHALPLAGVITMAAALHRLPARLVLLGVEVVDLTPGDLSLTVLDALDAVVERVRALVEITAADVLRGAAVLP